MPELDALEADEHADAVIDVDDELSYWSQKLPDLECYRPLLPLDQYTRTLRFAYDSYLLHPHDSADLLMPCLLAQVPMIAGVALIRFVVIGRRSPDPR
jgi:hypothetical protein